MADFPNYRDFNSGIISPGTDDSLGYALKNIGGLSFVLTAVWPSANLAFYIPFRVAQPIIATKMYWYNGTVGTDSVDVGIYGQDGTRLVSSGTVATSGANAIQSSDITDTTLNPGLYYMAMAMNGTTNTQHKTAQTAGFLSAMGVYEQTSAFNLPATATFATSVRNYLPFFAITTKTVI